MSTKPLTIPSNCSSSSTSQMRKDIASLTAQMVELRNMLCVTRGDQLRLMDVVDENCRTLDQHSLRLQNADLDIQAMQNDFIPATERRLSFLQRDVDELSTLRTDVTQLSYAVTDVRLQSRDNQKGNRCSCPECHHARGTSVAWTERSEGSRSPSSECVVLTTSMSCFVHQKNACERVTQLLDQLRVVFTEIDCSFEENREIRDRYFEISGVGAVYPQVFLQPVGVDMDRMSVSSDSFPDCGVTYIGSLDAIQKLEEMDSLPAELVEAEGITTFSSVFAGDQLRHVGMTSVELAQQKELAAAAVAAHDGDAAVHEAERCLQMDDTDIENHLLLSRALLDAHRYDEAVSSCKRGLKLDATHAELLECLQQARIRVLEQLNEDSESEDEVPASSNALQRTDMHSTSVTTRAPTTQSAPPSGLQSMHQSEEVLAPNGFDAKFDRMLKHLDAAKLARIAAVYFVVELSKLRAVTLGVTLLVAGLVVQAFTHRHKVMLASLLFVCVYRSKLRGELLKRAERWAHTSTNKLGAITWLPRVICCVPIVMKVFGHVKFFALLHQDVGLAVFVTMVTSVLVLLSLRVDDGHFWRAWGTGKRLKLSAYLAAVTYLLGFRWDFGTTLKLLGPALIDAGGVALSSLSSQDIQAVCKRVWKRVFDEVATDVQQDVEIDTWFMLGLTNWFIDYWQQPTDFSLAVLMQMIKENLALLEKRAVEIFRPELHRLQSQMTNLQDSDELIILVKYLKQSMADVPPSNPVGKIGLVCKRCPSFVVFGLLVTFYGIFSLPLLPFLTSEARDAQQIYAMHVAGDLDKMDGLEVLLLDSPLLRVWDNAKIALNCLEGAATMKKTMETGVQIVQNAARAGFRECLEPEGTDHVFYDTLRSRLAGFVSRVAKEGLIPNIHDLPDTISEVALMAQDSSFLTGFEYVSSIANGVQLIYESGQLQLISSYIWSWWGGEGKPEKEKPAPTATEPDGEAEGPFKE
ncbi:TPA: hypothetical protein N0F65_001859 [Lagenidium giganteum]|uniref:Uncharacterized protein n=1 Tax=Lagenidium giganteum TaxID=4803 RepID=A0AAV2YN60_9STRA|nr:TPA: hypothetical protein N0F65_001859 [Lagenidium giganteum]